MAYSFPSLISQKCTLSLLYRYSLLLQSRSKLDDISQLYKSLVAEVEFFCFRASDCLMVTVCLGVGFHYPEVRLESYRPSSL